MLEVTRLVATIPPIHIALMISQNFRDDLAGKRFSLRYRVRFTHVWYNTVRYIPGRCVTE